MRQILLLVAVVSMVTTGCTSGRMMGRGCGGQACGVTTSQRAPRPAMMRPFSCFTKQCSHDCDASCGCDPACGCDASCGCDPACGCDASCGCDPACGCDTCADPCCSASCCEGCCSDMGDCANGCFGADGCSDGTCRMDRGGMGAGGQGSGCRFCGGAGCNNCRGGGFAGAIASGLCPHAGGYPETPNFNPGPPTGQTAYPYYTVRGPRDFLRDKPPTIGPY